MKPNASIRYSTPRSKAQTMLMAIMTTTTMMTSTKKMFWIGLSFKRRSHLEKNKKADFLQLSHKSNKSELQISSMNQQLFSQSLFPFKLCFKVLHAHAHIHALSHARTHPHAHTFTHLHSHSLTLKSRK